MKGRRSQLVSVAGQRLLVVPVNTRQYGHMALELAMGFAEAAKADASVMWSMQGDGVAPGLATLECLRVPVVTT